MKHNMARLLWSLALPLLLVLSCEKTPHQQKGNVGLSAEYLGESARGLEFRLSVTGATPGMYVVTAKTPAGQQVFSSQAAVLATSSFDIAVPVEAFTDAEKLTCVLESKTLRGETELREMRSAGGTPAVLFREGDHLLLEMGRPHVITPVFFPSTARVVGRFPQWYMTSGCAVLQVSADGLSAKVGGLKEGNVEVGLYCENGKRGLTTKVVIPKDPAFSASVIRTDNFEGQTVSFSLKKEKAADPTAEYSVSLSVDGTAVDGVSPVPAERYDLSPGDRPLKAGEHLAVLQVSADGEMAYEFLLPFTVHPAPDPSFSVGGAGATHARLVLPHGRKTDIVMTTPGLVPDSYSLDFSASADLVSVGTSDGRTVTATNRGEGTFRLIVHKGDGTWTSEPLPVLSYGVIDVTPLLVYDGFKASAAKGGFKVENHPYGDGTVLRSLSVENVYTVHYGGGKSVTVEGTKKSFSMVSMESGHENRWSLSDDAQAVLDALGRAGATQASLEDLLIEQTLTLSFSDATLTVCCRDYENAVIHTTLRTKTVCSSLDPRIPTAENGDSLGN